MEKIAGKACSVQQNEATFSNATEETVVKKEGYCREGRWRIESEKRHKSMRGMFLLRLLSMERVHSIKSRHV